MIRRRSLSIEERQRAFIRFVEGRGRTLQDKGVDLARWTTLAQEGRIEEAVAGLVKELDAAGHGLPPAYWKLLLRLNPQVLDELDEP